MKKIKIKSPKFIAELVVVIVSFYFFEFQNIFGDTAHSRPLLVNILLSSILAILIHYKHLIKSMFGNKGIKYAAAAAFFYFFVILLIILLVFWPWS